MTTTITIPEPAATDSRQRRPQRGRDQAWLEWEALRWGVPVEIERADLQRLVEASTVLLEREKHRPLSGPWRAVYAGSCIRTSEDSNSTHFGE
jgi:hypothetical protein